MLDVGCGERPYAKAFPNVSRYFGVEHLGAVINLDSGLATSVAHVRSLIDAFAEGERLPFLDRSFQSVIATEVLEHVMNPERVVAEMSRVIQDGGLLLVSVPFVIELHQVPYDFRRYTVFGLRQLLEGADFEVIELVTRGNFVTTAGRVMAHAIYRLGAQRVKSDGAVKLRPWLIPIVLPLVAVVQALANLFGRFTSDDSLCMGYVALARRRPRTARS